MNINNILYDINKYYNIIDLENISINEIKKNKLLLINKYINNLKSTKYGNFQEIINNLEKSKYIYIINSNFVNINLYFYSSKKINIINNLKLLKVYKRLSIIYKYYNLNKIINIHLSFYNKSKTFPKKFNIFQPYNINSGFTNPNGNDIYVFRKDEYSKVLIHELIHHINILNLSISNMSNYNIIKLKNYFNFHHNCYLEIVESITEFWATLYTIIFISIENSIELKLILENEILFSLYQYKKIFVNYKYSNYNKYKWNENTNVFCYYIIKLILLLNYKKFLKLKIPYDENIFVDFVINNYKPDYYLKYKINNNYKFKKSLDLMLFSIF